MQPLQISPLLLRPRKMSELLNWTGGQQGVFFCTAQLDLHAMPIILLCTLFRAEYLHSSVVPESYHTNSKKEQLLLSYAVNFQRQFKKLYGDRKPLFLQPFNEHGIEVCLHLNSTRYKVVQVLFLSLQLTRSFRLRLFHCMRSLKGLGPKTAQKQNCSYRDHAFSNIFCGLDCLPLHVSEICVHHAEAHVFGLQGAV